MIENVVILLSRSHRDALVILMGINTTGRPSHYSCAFHHPVGTLIFFGFGFQLRISRSRLGSRADARTSLARIPPSPAFLCGSRADDDNNNMAGPAHESEDFLAVEAKWNVVCLGPQPSPPLGLLAQVNSN